MANSDRELIEAYRGGDISALEMLVERHRAGLYGYLFNMTHSAAEADEIYQEVWLRVIRKNGSYRHKNFGGWLVRVGRNIMIDRARKRKPDTSLDEETGSGHPVRERLAGTGPTPAGEVEAREIAERVGAAMKVLPAEQRDVFAMRMYGGLPFKEIARIQRTSINTVLARMQYALAKLRPLLQDLVQHA
jgi:RNA polymerase sigma-70 factor (ECF subfamily)